MAAKKTSRKKRKQQRVKSERAKAHGLPAREVAEAPRKRTSSQPIAKARPLDEDEDDDDRSSDAGSSKASKKAGLPPLAKLGLVAGVGLLAFVIVTKFMGDHAPATQAEPSASAAQSSAPPERPEAPTASTPDGISVTEPGVVPPSVSAPAPPEVDDPEVSVPETRSWMVA